MKNYQNIKAALKEMIESFQNPEFSQLLAQTSLLASAQNDFYRHLEVLFPLIVDRQLLIASKFGLANDLAGLANFFEELSESLERDISSDSSDRTELLEVRELFDRLRAQSLPPLSPPELPPTSTSLHDLSPSSAPPVVTSTSSSQPQPSSLHLYSFAEAEEPL